MKVAVLSTKCWGQHTGQLKEIRKFNYPRLCRGTPVNYSELHPALQERDVELAVKEMCMYALCYICYTAARATTCKV